MMSLTGIQKLDNLINQIKIKTFECINMILKYVFEQMQSIVKNQSPFLQRAGLIVQGLIATVSHLSQRADLEAIIEDEIGQTFIVEAIETLVILVGEKEFYEEFARFQRHLLVYVCLTFMRTTAPELE
jgi:hypothetical protein